MPSNAVAALLLSGRDQLSQRCRCPHMYARACVMGSYSESEKASQHREMPSNAVAALLLSGRNRQRRFPGTTLMMHGAPALVLAQHLGLPFTTGSFRACASGSRAANNGV